MRYDFVFDEIDYDFLCLAYEKNWISEYQCIKLLLLLEIKEEITLLA